MRICVEGSDGVTSDPAVIGDRRQSGLRHGVDHALGDKLHHISGLVIGRILASGVAMRSRRLSISVSILLTKNDATDARVVRSRPAAMARSMSSKNTSTT